MLTTIAANTTNPMAGLVPHQLAIPAAAAPVAAPTSSPTSD